MLTNEYLKRVYDTVLSRNPGEAVFHQAVREVLDSLRLSKRYMEQFVI